MDSTLIWPYHTKLVICLGCKDKFIFRSYGDKLENLIPAMDEAYKMEVHIKNCFGKEQRGLR